MKTILTLLFVFGCSLFAPAYAQRVNENLKSGLHVEVSLFSGRPNPTFVINDPAVIAEIMAKLENSPKLEETQKASEAKGLPAILGYKGLVVENFSQASKQIHAFVVNDSSVELKVERRSGAAGIETEKRRDAEKALESKLLSLIRAQGEDGAKIVSLIEKQVRDTKE